MHTHVDVAKDTAAAVRRRRIELGLTQVEAAGRSRGQVSVATWRVLEKGLRSSFRERTVAGVGVALDWPPDALVRVNAGETHLPTVWRDEGGHQAGDLPPTVRARLVEQDRRITELEHQVVALRRRQRYRRLSPTITMRQRSRPAMPMAELTK